jgi:hypothetical protein
MPGNTLLIHEEPQGHHGGRPDILLAFAPPESESVDQVCIVPIEIEPSSRAAIHDRRNGLAQLRRYSGHAKYLAIPRTVAVVHEAREIPSRCERHGVGLLVVDLDDGAVDCRVDPVWGLPVRGLRSYPVSMKRWIALRSSGDTYRRISGRTIVERD